METITLTVNTTVDENDGKAGEGLSLRDAIAIASQSPENNYIVETYSERNWVEVFYREAQGWLGLSEYQVREKKGLERHFILVFCAYTFMKTRILSLAQNREMSVSFCPMAQ